MPTLDGVLEEMRKGNERLQATREALQQERDDAIAAAKAAGEPPPKKAVRSHFGSTLDVLKCQALLLEVHVRAHVSHTLWAHDVCFSPMLDGAHQKGRCSGNGSLTSAVRQRSSPVRSSRWRRRTPSCHSEWQRSVPLVELEQSGMPGWHNCVRAQGRVPGADS